MHTFLAKPRSSVRLAVVAIFGLLLLSWGANPAFAAPTDGTRDTSFNSGGSGFNALTNGVALQPDGKVIVGGNFTTYNGITANRLIRLNIDGTIDSTFQTGTGLVGSVNVIHVLSDGSILIGGNISKYNDVNVSSVIKLSSTGVLDQTFTTNIGTIAGSVTDIELLADGKLVATGLFAGCIVKFASNGTVDNTFMTNLGAGFSRTSGGSTIPAVLSVVQQSSGNLVLVGTFNTFQGAGVPTGIASLTNDGQLVAGFQTNVGVGLNGFGTTLAQLSSGKIIVGGNFDKLGSITAGNIIGVNADGTHYTGFNTGGAGFSRQVEYISLDADENMYVSQQQIGTYNGSAVTALARLNTSGALDTSFSADVLSFKTVPTPTGGLYVTGYFTSYDGTSVGRFMRLDTVVTPPPGPDPQPNPVAESTLAETGLNSSVTAYTALSLLLAGGVLLGARRLAHRRD